MTILSSLLLALALCVDTLAVSTSSALKSKMSYRKGLEIAFVFGLFQGGIPLLGALLGSAFQSLVASIDHWIAFGLLFLVGGKMIIDGIRGEKEEKPLDVTKLGVIILLAIATSIDAFVVGIGFGLNSTIGNSITTCIIIGVVTFVVAIIGIYLGKRNVPIPEKAASIIAGLVLIGLGTHTLLEHTLLG